MVEGRPVVSLLVGCCTCIIVSALATEQALKQQQQADVIESIRSLWSGFRQAAGIQLGLCRTPRLAGCHVESPLRFSSVILSVGPPRGFRCAIGLSVGKTVNISAVCLQLSQHR